MKTLAAVAALLVAVVVSAPAAAASLEGVSALGLSSFDARLIKPLALPKKPKGTYVRVSGLLSLNGSGTFIGRPPTWANVNVGGWLTVDDGVGRYRSASTYVSGWVNVYVSAAGAGIFTTVNATIPVQLWTADGKLAGSGTVYGTIPLSGSAMNGWISLGGSSFVSGDVFVEDGKARR